ncbi:alanine racemase [Euzebya sp.]|uniref:alanine racemase n=1 Tax=Euzebya sp. TaxID=1971409 RepID=UPI003514F4BF
MAPEPSPTPPRHRPVWAEIDLDAIRHNAGVLRHHAGGVDLMAVVKADGYGHGAVPVARAALEGGATWLGVALVEEGEELRDAGITAPILVLSEPPPAAAGALLHAGLTPTVYTHVFTQALIAAAGDRVVDVHLKIDTGMHRVGLPEPAWDEAFAHLAASPRLRVAGLWSHLAVGDVPDAGYTRAQAERFADGVRRARAAGLAPDLLHLANSGGTTLTPDVHLDLVRPGIALYGNEAAPGILLDELRPAMALRSRLTFVKPLAAGESVSYGLRWTAARDTVVGTVAGGYADGIRRGLTNVGEVVVGGRRCPIAGTVCMDQFLVDLGPGATDASGDDVWLIGGPDAVAVTTADWARWLDTITYEVTCGISARVPRVHTSRR